MTLFVDTSFSLAYIKAGNDLLPAAPDPEPEEAFIGAPTSAALTLEFSY